MAKRDRRFVAKAPAGWVPGWILLPALLVPGATLAGTSPATTLSFDRPMLTIQENVADLFVELTITSDCDGLVRIPEATARLLPAESEFAEAGKDFEDAPIAVPLGVTGRSPITLRRVLPGLILDDLLPEGDEKFQLGIDLGGATAECLPAGGGEPAGSMLVAGAPATITIVDDEPPVRVSITAEIQAKEGDEGASTYVFEVTLSEPAPIAIDVTCSTVDGSATVADGDYQPKSETLRFAVGDQLKSVLVLVNGDRRVEEDEDFSVEIATATRGVEIVEGRGVGIILNDDEPPPEDLTLSIGDVDRAEGNSGTTLFDFPVRLSRPAEAAVVVSFATRDGSATVADRDYETFAGTLTFPPGTTRQTISVPVLGDGTKEDDEGFSVEISTATPGVEIARGRGTGTIRDDDAPTRGRVVSGDGQSGQVNMPLPEPLVIEVTDDDRRPLAGVPVTWSVARGTAQLEEEQTVTDGRGRTENRVVLGSQPGEIAIEARAMGVGEAFTFTLTAELILDFPALDETERPVAEALREICPRQQTVGDLRRLCDDVGGLARGQQPAALREIAPEEASSQATTAGGAQRTHLGNVGARIAALRGGAGRAASSQIVWNLGGVTLDGRQLASLFRSRRHDPPDLARLLDPQDDDKPPRRSPQPAGTSRFGERLGIFVNGTLGRGNRPATSRESGVDFDSLGLTAGADYQLGDHWVVGGALGFQTTDADLDDGGGTIDSEGYSLTAFGIYNTRRFYVDGVLLAGRTGLESERVIDFPGRERLVARADPDSDQLGLSLAGGYNRRFKGFEWNSQIRLDYLGTEVDGYRERGAPGFDLILDEQEIDSLVAALRLQLAYAISVKDFGVLRPTLGLGVLHEFEDPERLIVARFADDPLGTRFAIPTDEPDRDYLDLAVGLTATFPRGRQAFLMFEKDLDREDLNFYRFTFGFRFQLWRGGR